MGMIANIKKALEVAKDIRRRKSRLSGGLQTVPARPSRPEHSEEGGVKEVGAKASAPNSTRDYSKCTWGSRS